MEETQRGCQKRKSYLNNNHKLVYFSGLERKSSFVKAWLPNWSF